MYPESFSFQFLKRRVSIEQVLAHHGMLQRMRVRGHNLVGPCPLHGGDRSDAFVVHRLKNLWHCFTACQAGGDVVSLVQRLRGYSYSQAARFLASLESAPSSVLPPPPRPQPSFVPFSKRLYLDPRADFLRYKGIRPYTASRYEVGLYRGRGFLQHCIGVRLHSPDGAPLGYLGRRLDLPTKRPSDAPGHAKWKCPPGLPLGQVLYGWHRLPTDCHRLVITECPWGALRTVQLGHPAAALLGLNLTSARLKLLAAIPEVWLLLDADPAGQAANLSLAPRLAQYSRVRVLHLPNGADPDDLDDDSLGSILGPPSTHNNPASA